jgi:hypothetical protein
VRALYRGGEVQRSTDRALRFSEKYGGEDHGRSDRGNDYDFQAAAREAEASSSNFASAIAGAQAGAYTRPLFSST